MMRKQAMISFPSLRMNFQEVSEDFARKINARKARTSRLLESVSSPQATSCLLVICISMAKMRALGCANHSAWHIRFVVLMACCSIPYSVLGQPMHVM
ncbi:hypothetical protein P153DRAFT_29292 [Dothidotthia symphoricarpi CBS 119687]|uniref:Uncharacterized protein n=1 Tax=Dothidotthia symphoricarpi CBS 119687 TaxID=1392245 RepID=A0A6A6AB35_9PLEO|nr:uncharacterized protein P153DRAFT_29292 [Dothidotthia symphoricarpi CBS 119687]KAF2128979.1 hypothetical protein P153DRAFT_29292 [Dothidotthia symphoricarpi CBS 119687]